jgi:hypothetical protein
MRRVGVITRSADSEQDLDLNDEPLELERWTEYIASAPDVRPLGEEHFRNPFTQADMSVPREHSVSVVRDGVAVGRLIWSDGLIRVYALDAVELDWVTGAATGIGGTFHPTPVERPPPEIELPGNRGLRVALGIALIAVVAMIYWIAGK